MRACATAAVTIVLVSSSPALAGQGQQPGSRSPSVVTIERVENRVVVSPDYKFSRIDGDTGQLAGVTVGYLVEEMLFIGGAGYWLTSGAPGWDLSYGGLQLGFRVPAGNRIAFGAKALTGVGGATLNTTLAELMPNRDWPMLGLPGGRGGRWHMPAAGGPSFNTGETPVEVSDTFFVFEPQADITFTLTRRIRFGISGGYRATAGVDALGDRLNGATGTISVQVALP